MKLIFHQPEILNLRESLGREWLETNGRGGFASGTVANCHTRKYHGLLVASLQQPPGCHLLLSHLEDAVECDGRRLPLVTHQYADALAPDGHTRQLRFEQDTCPRFLYQCGELSVTRRVMMLPGRDAVLVRYDVAGPLSGAHLSLRPLLAYRLLHEVTQANGHLCGTTEPCENGFVIRPYAGMPPLHCQTNVRSEFSGPGCWYFRFHYAADAERGFAHREDLYCPGEFRVALRSGQPVIFAAATEPLNGNLARLWQQEERRRAARARQHTALLPRGLDEGEQGLYLALRRSGDQFLMTLPDGGPAVHAGYHWFGPWGRDTLLALPGLLFHGGQLDTGARILKAFARLEANGLLPNFLNPDGTGAYTAADPALWFFWAVQQYLAAGGSPEVVQRDFWPAMLSVIRHFLRGTDNGIVADADGLLRAGTPATAVTWMDAQVGGRPIVARWGYMVEINALWYNALCFAEQLARDTLGEFVQELAPGFTERVRAAFVRKFWRPDAQWLLDTVNEYCSDESLRPNVIFAVSLPFSPLSPEQQRAVIGAVKRDLFTPYGLRSLTPQDLRYHGTCQGENWVRELAYHQGSVWPWFLAHFAEALFKAEGKTRENRALFVAVTGAFEKHLREAGVGSVSEVFDGDLPHAPRGAISQAWNVGELLRLLHLLGS